MQLTWIIGIGIEPVPDTSLDEDLPIKLLHQWLIWPTLRCIESMYPTKL